MTALRGRVLIVEDKDNMRALLRDILASQHDITLAPDGAAGRAQLEAGAFEVVLTDVRMPGLDGFELVKLVKQRWPLTEVVMMTAFASVPAAVEAIRQGAYDYIQKPFDPDDVSLVVTRALERHRERVAAQQAQPTPSPTPTDQDLATLSYREALASARDRGSRDYLAALLKAFGGNVSRAAERAGLERESLHRLLRRFGIQAGTFRDPGHGGDDD
jgi:DNA-binding NtrC family response regulator